MDSELNILKSRGNVLPRPEKTVPASLEAQEAMKRYRAALNEFDVLIAEIQKYQGHPHDSVLELAIQRNIHNAAGIAADIRDRATKLKNYPSFISLETGIARYVDIARAADEAYWSRMADLEEMEIAFGRSRPEPSGAAHDILVSHEGFKNGHIRERHISQSMEQFKQRFLYEEEHNQPKTILSSFINDEIANDVVRRSIESNKDVIDRAINGQKIYIPIEESTPIGYVKERGKPPRFTKKGRLIVFKDSAHPSGYRIKSVELGKKGEQ